tara:strand:+ start:86 stop:280 length:195 start_codon:yes stop_codon:yes gene_type:complete
MSLFDKTKKTVIDLALTKGIGNPFDILSLERIQKQEEEFLKPKFNYSLLSLIPLAIIAFLVLKK